MLLCCVLWLAFSPVAHAGDTGTAAITVLPVDGQTRGVQIRAQTVDAVIHEEAGVVWADTRIWIDFHNTGKTPIVVPVALPGPQLAPVPLPEGLKATLNNKPLTLTPLPQRDDQPQIRVSTPVTVPAKGMAELRISYRQALPVQDGLATFAYRLTATANWSGRPESLRVTVRFNPTIAPTQILGYAPVEKRRERDGLTWHWENTEAEHDIQMAFIAPSWWAELETTRQAAASPAGLAEHAALAEHYWRLATLTPPPFQSEGYFDRFYPSAVEALAEGIARPGDAATPAEIAAARIRLAEIYQAQAGRLAADRAMPYLQLAASELQAALALHPTDAARQAAAALQHQLLALAGERGDMLAAQEHEARLAAITTATGLPSEQELARGIALTLAEQAVANGDLAAAAEWVAEAFGADATVRRDAPAPRIAQTCVSVSATPKERSFVIQVIGGNASGEALLAQARQALTALGYDAQISPGQLAFTLPYTDTGRLLAAQAATAAALAEFPELALLTAALRPAGLAWQKDAQPFLLSERYIETADLRSARAAWSGRAEQLQAAAESAMAASQPSEARLARIQAALWAEDAAAWRALADRGRVTYRVSLNTREIVREWELAAGETRELSAHAAQWRYDRLGGIAGGIALLLVLMVFVVWRAVRQG